MYVHDHPDAQTVPGTALQDFVEVAVESLDVEEMPSARAESIRRAFSKSCLEPRSFSCRASTVLATFSHQWSMRSAQACQFRSFVIPYLTRPTMPLAKLSHAPCCQQTVPTCCLANPSPVQYPSRSPPRHRPASAGSSYAVRSFAIRSRICGPTYPLPCTCSHHGGNRRATLPSTM